MPYGFVDPQQRLFCNRDCALSYRFREDSKRRRPPSRPKPSPAYPKPMTPQHAAAKGAAKSTKYSKMYGNTNDNWMRIEGMKYRAAYGRQVPTNGVNQNYGQKQQTSGKWW